VIISIHEGKKRHHPLLADDASWLVETCSNLIEKNGVFLQCVNNQRVAQFL
jgi:hypothetical protein